MEKVKKAQDNSKLLEFLVKTVPGVRQLGQAGKERVLSFFERCHFKGGDFILREGEKANFAYIIEEGEGKIVGSQNPLKRPGSAPARGLISKTTSCFNLGVVMPGEWVGEDSILTGKALEASVIASTYLTALRITREKFLDNLTRDTQNMLKENLGHKVKWREQRKQNISNAILKTVIDEEGHAEVASYIDAEKNYPKASKLALVNIKKQEQEKIEKQEIAEKNAQILQYFQEDPGKVNSLKNSRPQTSKTRPISAVTYKKSQSVLNASASSKNFLFSQSLFQKSTQNFHDVNSLKSDKVQLYSAHTLGGTLVPTMNKRPSTAKPKVSFNPVAPVIVKHVAKAVVLPGTIETFAQMVRKGRPPSPNPAEVWAKRKGIDLGKYNLLANDFS
jgi:CRP-like cAMP-binding protein